MITILGIDPGSRVTGYGVIQVQGQRHQHVASGCLKVGIGELNNRLRQIFHGISEVIHTYRPQEIVIEKIFMAKNPNAALVLGQARGAAIAATASHDLLIDEYTPREVKQAIVGYGNADKEQVQHMVKRLLNLSEPLATDAADALAIALCHAQVRSYRQRIQQATEICA